MSNTFTETTGESVRRGLCVLVIALSAIGATSGQTAERRAVDLTAAERTWLEAHPLITLAIDDAYPPYSYRNADGELEGLNVDYVRLLEKRLGARIDLSGSPWHDAIEQAMAHEVDGIVNVDKLPEREERLLFTSVFTVYPQALVTLGVSADFIERVEDILGIRFEFVATDSWNETVARVRRGGIDVIPAFQRTPAREPDFDFTRSYCSIPIAVFTRREVSFVSSLDSFEEGETAVVAGTGAAEVLDAEDIDRRRCTTIGKPYDRRRLLSAVRAAIDAGGEAP